MTDWLAICRRAAEDVERALREMPDPAERGRAVGQGEGGDETSAIDEAAEQVVVARLEAEGGDFTLVSEELGIRAAAGSGAPYVVVDPIDGSVNAKRGIPFFSLSIAVADGPTMGDIRFGFVHDFGSARSGPQRVEKARAWPGSAFRPATRASTSRCCRWRRRRRSSPHATRLRSCQRRGACA